MLGLLKLLRSNQNTLLKKSISFQEDFECEVEFVIVFQRKEGDVVERFEVQL